MDLETQIIEAQRDSLDEYIQKIEEETSPEEIYKIDVEGLRMVGAMLPYLAVKVAMHMWRILSRGLWVKEISGVDADDFFDWLDKEVIPYYQPNDRPYILDVARIVVRVFPVLESGTIINPKTGTRVTPDNIMVGNIKKLKAISYHIANAGTFEEKEELIQAVVTMSFSELQKNVLPKPKPKVTIPYKTVYHADGRITVEMPQLEWEQYMLLVELLGEIGQPITE